MVLFGACVLLSGTYRSGATRPPDVVTLQSNGDVVEASEPIGSISVADDERTLRLVSELTGAVESYRVEAGGSLRPLGRGRSAAVNGPGGYGVRADGEEVTVLDSGGKTVGKFKTPPPSSVAVLNSGDVAVASPDERGLIHVYSPAGRLLNRVGALRVRDRFSPQQNRFLHRGRVLTDAAGDFYYVYHYVPLIQKYSSDGRLLFEVEVRGEAVDLQQALAQRFFEIKKAHQVGGINVINGAAIERQTGHLWLAMNGSTVGGVVYEYDGRGRKLREYALQVNAESGAPLRLTGVRDVAVTRLHVFVLTNQQQVYAFDRDEQTPLGRWWPSARPVRPMLIKAFARTPQIAGCGTDQTWGSCNFVCPQAGTCTNNQPPANTSDGSTQDCKQALHDTLATGYSVVSASCTQYQVGTAMHTRGGCRDDVTICRAGGVNSSHNITLDCPAQSCATGGGGEEGGGECSWTRQDCEAVNGIYYNGCCDRDGESPVLVDTAGDGFALTDAAGGVNFDLDADGTPEHLSWTAAGSDDAWLALDRNGNGTVDSGAELFGNFTPQPSPPPGVAANGFNALARYDDPANGGNRDGVIDARDGVYASLRLWRDANHNGISESGELGDLRSYGVASISLDYKESRRSDDYGNRFRYRAKVDGARGVKVNRWAWDVFLVVGQ
ncbi:MAG: hypothetical protein JOZ96_16785 [Acidobacteria bacterium]|nr:hypothetical protein [Acidobacteriota bacterium]